MAWKVFLYVILAMGQAIQWSLASINIDLSGIVCILHQLVIVLTQNNENVLTR